VSSHRSLETHRADGSTRFDPAPDLSCDDDPAEGNPDQVDDRRGAISRRRLLGGALVAAVSPVIARSSVALGATGPLPDLSVCTVLNGLVATVGATGPARVRIRAWPTSDPSAELVSGWWLTNAARAATVSLPTAASDGRAWSWQGDVQSQDGSSVIASTAVRKVPARAVAGPTSFTFAFGCCMTQRGDIPSLRVARSRSPIFFATIGDMGYKDDPVAYPNTQNYAGFVDLFRKQLKNPDFAPLLAETPFYGMQDDHDYGKDGCDRNTVKSYAAQAYADLVPGASWPGSAYRRWSIGDVDFFLTDNRRDKDPTSGPYQNGRYMSVLGATQRAWLLDGLAASTAPVKFVFVPMTMVWYWSRGERAEVREWINDRVSGTVIFLSGDKHAGGFAHWPNRVWEFLAAPLKNPVKHATPSTWGVLWTENGTGRALHNCVGIVDVDTGAARTVTLRLVREDGVELHREVVRI
jgi:PhoD-like phosphatase